jgi:transposase InsO family protein
MDRLILVGLYRLGSNTIKALTIETSVAKYLARRSGPPSQGWKTFLRSHADGIAAMDLFVVPTISFRLLYGLLIMGHGRRQILWFGVTAHPTTELIANQLTQACGWEQLPRYLIRDRDRAYGEIFVRRVRSIGIRDRPTSFRSPWQNACAERLIGSIRRECIDHIVVFGERHLRHVLLSYMNYYNATRTAHGPLQVVILGFTPDPKQRRYARIARATRLQAACRTANERVRIYRYCGTGRRTRTGPRTAICCLRGYKSLPHTRAAPRYQRGRRIEW